MALSLIGGVVVLAFTKLYGIVFLGSPRTTHVAEATEVDSLRLAAMAIPAALILSIGLLPQYTVRPVIEAAAWITGGDYASTVAHLLPTLSTVSIIGFTLLALIGALYWLKRRAQSRRTVSSSPTWGCGFTAVNERMQYTGRSFAEGSKTSPHRSRTIRSTAARSTRARYSRRNTATTSATRTRSTVCSPRGGSS